MILVGDIGGTKTRLAFFSTGSFPVEPSRESVFVSSQYTSFEDLVREFLSRDSGIVKAAVFGVAGPVLEGRAKLTNLPWVLDEARLAEVLAIPRVVLVNDVLATAAAIPHLGDGATLTLQEGKADPNGNAAVIAPGTGLGEAFVARDGGAARAYAGEGGHVDFAPRNEEEMELWHFLKKNVGRVSYETVCSGPGIAHIYRYLQNRFPKEEDPRVKEALIEAVDPVPQIVAGALRKDRACSLCERTLRLFASILGAEAGNLALKVLATGGVYLAGGIPPRILPFLREEGFLRSFQDKGCMSELMKRIPVHVIMEPRAALLGAAYWLRERENDQGHSNCM